VDHDSARLDHFKLPPVARMHAVPRNPRLTANNGARSRMIRLNCVDALA